MGRSKCEYRKGKKKNGLNLSTKRRANKGRNIKKLNEARRILKLRESAKAEQTILSENGSCSTESNLKDEDIESSVRVTNNDGSGGSNENLDRFTPPATSTPEKVSNPDPDSSYSVQNEEMPSRFQYPSSNVVGKGSNSDASYVVTGRRVIDISHFFTQLKEISDHGPFGCTLKNMDITGEVRKGQNSMFTLTCNMYKSKHHISTDDPQRTTGMYINTAVVSGVMCAGAGYRQLEELTAAMDMPVMSVNTYAKYHDIVCDGWGKTALQEMETSAAEEAAIAVARGEVDKNGIPILTVIADGAYAKCSYKNSNYSSLSGVAAIVGFHTRKVLFLGVRNRYCTICARAERQGKEAGEHICYKNWSGSACSMEADIIAEGFKSSLDMYGVKYGTLIADGDCSVYTKLVQARPYVDLSIDKIECRNHIMRNYGNKLKDIATNSKLRNVNLRKILGSSIKRMRVAVVSAARHWAKQSTVNEHEKISNFRKDVSNVPRHIFGDHGTCASYFCKGSKEGEKNLVPELETAGILPLINEIHIHTIQRNARSLLKDLDSNAVEQFNNVIAKFVGGKRVNFALKRSYRARSYAAVVSFNSKKPFYKLNKAMNQTSPGQYTKIVESRCRQRAMRERTLIKKRSIRTVKNVTPMEISYGPNVPSPDMTPLEYDISKTELLASLPSTNEERQDLESRTLLQRNSRHWKEIRRKLLTASNFGAVCRRKPYTSCEKLVASLLYMDFDTDAMIWGRSHEKTAIQCLEEKMGVKVEECGLFVDPLKAFLGATPDGVIGKDGLVEVKCPSSGALISPEDLILQRKCSFWNVSKDKRSIGDVNKNHHFYYQVQGQLHVTRRQYCMFGLWTPQGLRIEIIHRDDDFWSQKMETPLTNFYMDSLLPELVDPRRRRSMPIRNPQYIVDEIEKFTHKRRQEENQNENFTNAKKQTRRKLPLK